MKIGILTYHRAHNYGALLQAIATRTVLKKIGHDVHYIDYWPDYHKKKYQIFSMKKLRSQKFKYIINLICNYSNIKRRIKVFKTEVERYIVPFCSNDTQYDAIIYGSDQIWRKQHELGDYNSTYFASGKYRARLHIAFAASMGKVIPSECVKLVDSWKRFSSIGVREDDLRDVIINNGIDCELNCDPTFLLSAQEWDEILNVSPIIKEPYVLYYSLNKEAFDEEAIKNYATERDLKVVEICGAAKKESVDVYPCATVCQFVSLIKYADTVFSSSFHGMVFALLYHKKFYVSNKSNTMRQKLLLQKLGLDYLFVEPGCKNFTSLPELDYETIENKKGLLIKQTLHFLNVSLGKKA